MLPTIRPLDPSDPDDALGGDTGVTSAIGSTLPVTGGGGPVRFTLWNLICLTVYYSQFCNAHVVYPIIGRCPV